MNTTGAPSQPRTVAVDVVDPDLDADVRAVLAALALDPRPRDGGPVEVLVTDRPADTAAAGPTRLVRVAGDGTSDDDEVVLLPSGTARLVGLLSTPVESSGSLVAVVGAVGGCGTSTVAAALAVRASGRGRTLLVEADPRGPGIDLLLGSEAEPGLRVGDVRSDLGGPDPEALWAAVPRAVEGCGVLARARHVSARAAGSASGEAPTEAQVTPSGAALGAALAHRGAGGLVVCDGGRAERGDPLPGRADLVVVVTGSDLQGAVAAAEVARTVAGDVTRRHLLVRAHRGDPVHPADVAASVGVERWDVLPEIPAVRSVSGSGGLAAALSRGGGGRLRRLAGIADAVLDEGGLR
ncbi:MAG TPA: chromosome partitioning protein [Candidatus Dietzia intestinipullorum]|nr:chromosome partitioning protein [Candidatus Dietzia intestinipullorum]